MFYWLSYNIASFEVQGLAGRLKLKSMAGKSCVRQRSNFMVFVIWLAWFLWGTRTVKADSQIACRAPAVPLPCRAAKSLECVFYIWFTECDRVWFILVMPCPCHAPTMPFFSRPQHSTTLSRRPCCAVALWRTAWSEHGTGMAWQVWIRHGSTV